MNAETLSHALGGIDLKYIAEAADYRRPRAKKRRMAPRLLAAAACLALAVYAGTRWLAPDASVRPTIDPNLQVLDVITDSYTSMGAFVMHTSDFSDYLTGNPWSEDMELYTLPVYKNAVEHASYELNRVPLNADYEAMRAIMDGAIAALGIDESTLEFSENTQQTFTDASGGDTVVTSFVAQNSEVRISVGYDLELYVAFANPVELPVDFTRGSTAAECEAAGEYAAGLFSALLGFQDPQVSVSGGEFNYDLSTSPYSVRIYDAGSSDEEMLINYNFRCAELYASEDGGVSGLRLFNPDLSHKVGDYPIISVDEARSILLGGGELPGTLETLHGEDIVGVELVYRINEYDEYFVPYYCFYSEVSEALGDVIPEGDRAYTWHYVPAVDPQHLSVYTSDGSGN